MNLGINMDFGLRLLKKKVRLFKKNLD
jgi:hypothetical protein